MLILQKLYLAHMSITRDYYIRQTITKNRHHVLERRITVY